MKIITLIIGLIITTLNVAAAGTTFPGPRRGPARAQINGNQLVLENDFLAVRWDLSNGLHLVDAKDKQSDQTWPAGPSECLQVILYDPPSPNPRTLTASQMKIIGRPTVLDAPVLYAGREANRYPGKEIVVRLAAVDGSMNVEWRATMRDESNYVRQTLVLEAGADWLEPNQVTLVDVPANEAEVRGSVDGSPVVAGRWFMALEHPMSRSEVTRNEGSLRVRCSYPFAPPLAPNSQQEYSAVLGLAPKDQIRRGFLYYLNRERAHPYRPFLHPTAGEDMGHMYTSLNKKPDELKNFQLRQNQWWQDVLEEFGRELATKRNVVIDCFAHDYLWDDIQHPWLFDGRIYPRGFTDAQKVADKYGATLGVWFSPDAVTGSRGRVIAGIEQKFEGYRVGTSNEAYTLGLSPSGPRYFARLRAAAVNMLRRNGVGYFKFDGIADGYRFGYKPSGAGQFSSDVEALIEIYKELRRLNPNVFINASTGSWPSPFWLCWADSIWHQGADVGTYGPEFEGFAKGLPRQRWITYRDSATYQNGWVRGPLYPLNSYMLHGLEYNICSTRVGRQRVAGLETKDFIDEIHSYFGTGTNLQELHVTPSLMTPQTWDILAEAARWSRANSDVLADAHWVGGDPASLDVYGWAAWSARKGVLTLRNPDDQIRSINVDIGNVFELPEGAAQNYRLTCPWQEKAEAPAIELQAGHAHEFRLQPFEVLVFDALPL